jgi:hypothetical protein
MRITEEERAEIARAISRQDPDAAANRVEELHESLAGSPTPRRAEQADMTYTSPAAVG